MDRSTVTLPAPATRPFFACASRLHTGQVYDVYVTGKEIKDPVSGEVLGHDENRVGRVTLTDLQPKLSKARIWEDKGITVGAILRRAG